MIRRKGKVLAFWVLSWVILANLFILYRFVGLNWSEEVFVLTAKEWVVLFGQATFVGIFAGVFFALLDLYLFRKKYFHRVSFGLLIGIKSVVYLIMAIAVLFLAFYLAARLNGYEHIHALDRAYNFYGSGYFLVIIAYLFLNSIFLNFLQQVIAKFGPGNFIHVFSGHYHKPIEEERIFVFIDLKSSTHYAETLGHMKYSKLIQDCFYDITSVVYDCKAEIFQYAGDEIILTWRTIDPECYRHASMAFFAFQAKIEGRKQRYIEQYGLVPEFKAGIHAGKVMATEVGVIKKEIAYHGDTINTASRIQEQCNKHNRRVLCSESFIQKLGHSNEFDIVWVGEVVLKGKKQPVKVYGLEKTGAEYLGTAQVNNIKENVSAPRQVLSAS